MKGLEFLGKKFIDNPSTLKTDVEEVDHLALLEEAFQNNVDGFKALVAQTEEFYTLESERHDNLLEAIQDQEAQEINDQHTPEIEHSGVEQVIPPGTDFPPPGNHRFDEVPLYGSKGVLPSQIPTYLPHEPG